MKPKTTPKSKTFFVLLPTDLTDQLCDSCLPAEAFHSSLTVRDGKKVKKTSGWEIDEALLQRLLERVRSERITLEIAVRDAHGELRRARMSEYDTAVRNKINRTRALRRSIKTHSSPRWRNRFGFAG